VRGHEAYRHALLGVSHVGWLSRAERPGLLFNSQVRAAWSNPEGSPLDRWPLSSSTESGGVIPGTGYPTPIIWLLVEFVVSRLLGCNWQPVAPSVEDPDSSPRAFHQAGGRSRSLVRWHNRSSHGTVRVTT
jgi:hypothetical protein